MGNTMGTLDFFLLEAGEYLERLDALAQSHAGAFSAGDDFVRLTRAFRGSAIMANQHGMARAAQGLESVARAVREGRLPWSEAVRGEVVRAVDDCKVVMRRLRTPEQGDTERAEAIGIRLDRLSGRASGAGRVAAGPGLDAGARAFVAREAASIASVLQHVARSLRSEPAGLEVLQAIAPAMSALRGVAVLNDLPPLGDVLSAVDGAVKEVSAAGTGAADAPDVFEAGGRALARAAREVVDTGRPDPESDEAKAFAQQLLALAGGGTVVPVESLFFDDAGPHVVSEGRAPAARQPLARVDMVSQGEYLTAAAAELARAGSTVQRDLRFFAIAASLRPVSGTGGAPLADALGRLAEAAREAIGSGAAGRDLDRFTTLVREAASVLVGAQSGEEGALASRLAGAADELTKLATAAPEPQQAMAPAPVAAAAPPAEAPVAPAPEAPAPAPKPAFVAPSIRSETPPPAAPAPAALAQEAWPGTGLATSYLALEQFVLERGMQPGSIEELLGLPAAAAAAAAAPAAAASELPVVPVESLAPVEEAIVPIEDLLYRGDAALRRILELKRELLDAAVAGAGEQRLHALLHEVFDLVELGLTADR